MVNFLLERFQCGEFSLRAEEFVEFQCDLPAVQVPLVGKNPGLHGDAAAMDGGAGADVGDGGVALPLQLHQTGVNAELGDHQPGRQRQIGGGDAQGAAQLVAVDDLAGENMGMAQEGVGLLHLPLLQQGADVGGGNPGAVDGLLRHHGPGQVLPLAVVCQQCAVAGAAASEAEIVSADEACSGIVPAEKVQKFLPGCGVHFFIKGQGDYPVQTAVQKPLPIGGGVDQHRGGAEYQRVRVGIEGHGSGLPAGFPGKPTAFI